jgi:hypothetical protein
MYRDAKEELKRLEQALLEEDDGQDDISQWDLEDALADIPDLPKKKKKKDNRNKVILGLTVAVILLTAAMVGILIFLFAGYGRWF